MLITLNSKIIKIDNKDLLSLLKDKLSTLENIVVEYNYRIIKEKDWKKIILKENDHIEILRFLGGG